MAEKTPDSKKIAQTRQGLSASKRGTPLSSGRLQSIRTPRDLTLGGASKRTYTPTIPVRRIKEEPKDGPSEQNTKGGGQTRSRGRGRGRGRERGRGRGRGQPNIIQSKSTFSEIMVPKKGAFQSRAPSYGGGGGGDGEGSKSVRVKAEKDFDVKDSEEILKMLDGDGEMEMDEDQLECGILPFHIPLAYHDRFIVEVQEGEDISAVKDEPMDTNEKKPLLKPSTMVAKKTQAEKQMTCERLLTGDDVKKKEQMLFFQFPDSLPTNVFDDDENESKSKNRTLKLQDISEGYIGKIQVHKSGKTKLLLGGVALDVSMGTPCNFLQDIVSIHPEEELRSMMTLCHVKQRLVCTPDFEELLKDVDIT